MSLESALPEFELKYEIPVGREAAVSCALDQLCERDQEYPESYVSSVYFDSRDFDSLGEKTNGDYVKTKVRLRWYEMDGVPQGERAFIEVKQKLGNRRTKRRLTAPLPASRILNEPLDGAAFKDLDSVLRGAGILTHGPLEAMLTVRFRRRRYRERATGCRVSLDTSLSVPRFNPRFLSSAGARRLPPAIVEMKGPSPEMSPWLGALVDFGCRKVSLSKYALCLEQHPPIHR